ncbi:MAG: KUP/HAK/KT family potassium transporter, partial [Solirubrobacteraceae bacterium]
NRIEKEGPLPDFLNGLGKVQPALRRVPGTAVFLSPRRDTTPLALQAEVAHNHVLHEKVLIVSVEYVSVPHVDADDQLCVQWLGHGLFKIMHVLYRVGYRDKADVPKALTLARKRGLLERNLDLEHASYFISRMMITATDAPGMSRERKKIFITMARNSSSSITHFGLPSERTVMMGSQVEV